MAWLFWICVSLLLYAYLLYPLILKLLACGKRLEYAGYTMTDDLPQLHIIIPAHNEAKVIGRKTESLFQNQYPPEKISLYVGLDACTDATREIIENFRDKRIQIVDFPDRTGKPGILNSIVSSISDPEAILVFTDADILLGPQTLFEMVRFFKDERIGLVDSQTEIVQASISEEKQYAGFESAIKYWESLAFGRILGPSGGCYAIRRKDFTPIPANFLVDDFLVGMEVVLHGKQAIINPAAVCTEEKNAGWEAEYRRKVRIAAGSFQNLWRYKKLLFRPFTATWLIFVSHKVLRWKTPFLLLVIYGFLVFQYPFVILIITFFLPFFVLVFGTLGWKIRPLYALLYYLSMNVAVLVGFLKFIKGINNNVWQPTSR